MDRRSDTVAAILLLVSLAGGCSLLPAKQPLTWHLILEIAAMEPDRDTTLRETIGVIEKRLNSFGLTTFEVRANGTQGSKQILVSLPDVADRQRLKQLVTAPGRLQLAAIVSPPSPAPVQTYSTESEAIASLNGKVPANRRVLSYVERAEATQGSRWVVVESPPIVDGNELRNATSIPSATDKEDYQIVFSLKPDGAQRFGDWTGSHITEYVGVVLNDEVRSIAFIKSQIYDSGEISGRFTKQSAEDLVQVLNSGSLPARVRIVEEGPNK